MSVPSQDNDQVTPLCAPMAQPPPSPMPPANVLWNHYWHTMTVYAKTYQKHLGESRSSEPGQEANRGIYMFASSLGIRSILKLFDFLCADVVVKRVVPLRDGFWIFIFGSHSMARTIIREGHGRLPLPGKGFPYFDESTWVNSAGQDHEYRLDMTWVRRSKPRPMKAKPQ